MEWVKSIIKALDYIESNIMEEITIEEITQHTWAVFPCVGPMPQALQEINHQNFTQWLPNCKEYEISAGYNFEMYTDIKLYPKGNQDEKYYSEIWIPVKIK